MYEYDFVVLTNATAKALEDINSRAADRWRLCNVVLSPNATAQIFVMERLQQIKENNSNDPATDTTNGPSDEGSSTEPDDVRHTGRSKPT